MYGVWGFVRGARWRRVARREGFIADVVDWDGVVMGACGC